MKREKIEGVKVSCFCGGWKKDMRFDGRQGLYKCKACKGRIIIEKNK